MSWTTTLKERVKSAYDDLHNFYVKTNLHGDTNAICEVLVTLSNVYEHLEEEERKEEKRG